MIKVNPYRKIRVITTSLMAGVLMLALGSLPAAAADSPIVFGHQAWPGVTVKSRIAVMLLDTMGFPAKSQNFTSAIIYQGLKSGDVDVSLGAWMPAHKDMVDPLVDAGDAIMLSKNLTGAIQGLAVPEYVWKKGVHSISDLSKHGDMFDEKIYGISPGAAMSRRFQKAIDDNYENLGDWKLMTSSTAGMLAQVERATQRKEPIVFHGWRPHWMNIKFHIRFLTDDQSDSPLAEIKSTVYTIVPTHWTDKHPQVTQFLRQFKVTPETQSRWIYQFSYKHVSEDKVAKAWISQHLDQVAKWLDGVKAADGQPAMDSIRKKFGN